MKTSILVLLLLLSLLTKGQAFAQSSVNNSITITPEGLKGRTVLAATSNNITLGEGALSHNTTGIQNTAIGFKTLSANSSGNENTAIGNASLERNTTGYSNTALGSEALGSNSTGSFNTASGRGSLERNSSGTFNTANGEGSLENNNTGNYNTASGASSLHNNQIGHRNTAIGYGTLLNSGIGNNNTAVGHNAGSSNTYGSNNTYLGYLTGASGGDFTNVTAVGYMANVNSPNKVRIGNSDVTAIEGQVAWSNPSDRRLKENIVYTSALGLNFINRLQTVSYNYISDKTKVRHDGFIAQDIEKVMTDLGVPFSGLKKSDDGTYALAYSDFVMPLVNAIKEQQQQINELKRQNEVLAQTLSDLKEIRAEINKLKEESKERTSERK